MHTRQNNQCSRGLTAIRYGILLALLPLHVFAASLATETFFDSTGGWQDRDAGKMSVTNALGGGNPGGCMRGVFQFQMIPFPEDDAFIATGRLASANFIGDYESVDAWLLGFDFMASNIVPSDVQVRIHSGSNTIVKTFTTNAISTTKTWYSFKISLLSAELGGWSGDTHVFSSILTNVTRVEFRITRNGENAQFYYVDNVFLDRVPDAVDISSANMIWLHMRNGAHYRFEATTNLNQSNWDLIDSFTATTSVYQADIVATNDWRFFRMVME